MYQNIDGPEPFRNSHAISHALDVETAKESKSSDKALFSVT